MNLDKLSSIAKVPRKVAGNPQLQPVWLPYHVTTDATDFMVAGGVVATIITLITGWRHWTGWTPFFIALALAPLAFVIKKLVQPAAMQNGERLLASAPVVLGAVVQANNSLYEPGDYSLPAVVVFSTSPQRAMDTAWLKALAHKLAALRNAAPTDPVTFALAARLNDERRSFSEPLPAAFAGDPQAHWKVQFIKQSQLPERRIPEDGVIPFFLVNGSWLRIVPATYWS